MARSRWTTAASLTATALALAAAPAPAAKQQAAQRPNIHGKRAVTLRAPPRESRTLTADPGVRGFTEGKKRDEVGERATAPPPPQRRQR
jgi:hypothetical protein